MAQQAAVCSDMPGSGERVECTEDADSSNDIKLSPKGVDIDTTEDDVHGIYGEHQGTGDIFFDLMTEFDETRRALIRPAAPAPR